MEDKQKTKFSFSKAFPLMAFLALIVAGVSFFVAIWSQQRFNHQLSQLQMQFSQTKNLLAAQQAVLDTTQQSLLQQTQQFSYQSEQWTLAESLYLLKLARYHLLFFHNVKLAIRLVKMAEKNLAELNDSRLLQARQELNKSLVALKVAERIDTTGILLQLNAIQNEIPQMMLAPTASLTHISPPAKPLTLWQKIWNEFKPIIIVQRIKNPPPPLLSPSERIYLINNIQYQLTQAQWAAMHYQDPLYHASLNQAINWINNYFQINNQATQSVINLLDQLNTVNVAPQLPDISSAIHAVDSALETTTNEQKIKSKSNKKASPQLPVDQNIGPKAITS